MNENMLGIRSPQQLLYSFLMWQGGLLSFVHNHSMPPSFAKTEALKRQSLEE